MQMKRRHLLKTLAVAGGAAHAGHPGWLMGSANGPDKRIAVIATIYRPNSHADVICGKMLHGWKEDRGAGPRLSPVSMYIDQFPEDDMAKKLCLEFDIRLCKTIDEALTFGTDALQVDGVISIGEHGDYPWNELEQHLYPRKRFFEDITDAMRRVDGKVPVFNDKHPGPQWEDAWWMYQRAKEMELPWMAGSSLPVSYRSPDRTLGWKESIQGALAVGYSGLDIYGFHTLDFLQAIIERRPGGGVGVQAVEATPCKDLDSWVRDQKIDRVLLDLGLEASGSSYDSLLKKPPEDGCLFLIEYADGLRVPVVMLGGAGSGISVAIRPRSGSPWVTKAEERTEPRYPHFAYLLKGMERMFWQGKPSYPVERTMIAAGVLDRCLVSRKGGYQRIETPMLNLHYQPVDYGYAPHIDLLQEPSA
ncbi:MAG: hypothetical protein ACK43N_17245 [Pirellulaceae bacterium]|jgi:hypothetical protein